MKLLHTGQYRQPSELISRKYEICQRCTCAITVLTRLRVTPPRHFQVTPGCPPADYTRPGRDPLRAGAGTAGEALSVTVASQRLLTVSPDCISRFLLTVSQPLSVILLNSLIRVLPLPLPLSSSLFLSLSRSLALSLSLSPLIHTHSLTCSLWRFVFLA
jgi:hypothetical protein